jgi:hypothetical protein
MDRECSIEARQVYTCSIIIGNPEEKKDHLEDPGVDGVNIKLYLWK